jgi:hypothetical protein
MFFLSLCKNMELEEGEIPEKEMGIISNGESLDASVESSSSSLRSCDDPENGSHFDQSNCGERSSFPDGRVAETKKRNRNWKKISSENEAVDRDSPDPKVRKIGTYLTPFVKRSSLAEVSSSSTTLARNMNKLQSPVIDLTLDDDEPLNIKDTTSDPMTIDPSDLPNGELSAIPSNRPSGDPRTFPVIHSTTVSQAPPTEQTDLTLAVLQYTAKVRDRFSTVSETYG